MITGAFRWSVRCWRLVVEAGRGLGSVAAVERPPGVGRFVKELGDASGIARWRKVGRLTTS